MSKIGRLFRVFCIYIANSRKNFSKQIRRFFVPAVRRPPLDLATRWKCTSDSPSDAIGWRDVVLGKPSQATSMVSPESNLRE